MGLLETASKVTGMTPAGLITGGLSVAGQIFGAIKSAKENKENQNLLNKQMHESEADYNNAANKSYLETNAAKDQVKVINDQAEKARKDAAGRSVITGASDEAVVAANDKIQKNTNNAMSNLAGQATNYQEGQKRMYLGRKDRLNALQMQMNQQKAQQAGSLAGNAADLFSTVTYSQGMKDFPTEGKLSGTASQVGISQPNRDWLNKNAGQ